MSGQKKENAASVTMPYRAGHATHPARWEHVLRVILLVPGGLVLLLMLGYIVANALSRTLTGVSVPATLELVQHWFMPLIVSFGLVGAQLTGQHMDADLFFGWFSNRGKKALTIAVRAFSCLFIAFWSYWAFQEALYATSRNIRAGFTDIPAWPAYYALGLALLGMALVLLMQVKRAILSPADSYDESMEEQLREQLEESVA